MGSREEDMAVITQTVTDLMAEGAKADCRAYRAYKDTAEYKRLAQPMREEDG